MARAWTLGILLLAGSAASLAGAAEETFNYDEAQVAPYELPNVLQLNDGRFVTTSKVWQEERRKELLELFQKHVYGRRPADPQKLDITVVENNDKYLNGKATRLLVRIDLPTKDGPQHLLPLTLIIPNEAPGPVPVFVGMHLFDTAAEDPIPGKLLDVDVGVPLPGKKILEVILDRGYAIATLNAKDFCPDDKANHRQGVLEVLAPGRGGPPDAEEPGAIAIWAWGLSRALDYIEGAGRLDAKRVAVIGHSRMGKTALWAGAQDERFAMVISNNSGCGGAALSRRNFGETVARINRVFPHWFCGNFKQYGGHESELPVDQHELVALAAPRPVYVASAQEDGWADPQGEFLAALGAEPVYQLFRVEGLGTSTRPALNESIGGAIGYHIRSGKHALTDFDWLKYLDFADKHWKKTQKDEG